MMRRYIQAACLVVLAAVTLPGLAGELPNFTDIVQKYSPAVVKITTVQKFKAASGNPQELYGVPPDQLPEIFRHLFEYHGQPQPRERESLGSGFIISRDGYILTNRHVVDGADKITVRLSDRREFDARVVGTDKHTDIALLKIKAKDLPVVKLAKPGELKVGQWVLAIGSPFGLDYSATAGIVSAIGRSIPNDRNETYVPFIQTDVAINPGNSGGPLFDMDGEVVGINSQIYTRSGGSIGLSFAIPIGLAMDVVHQLKTSGHVERGWLGVGIQEVSRDLAQSFGLNRPTGALVSFVDDSGPAAKAGIRVGDIIVAFDGKKVDDSAALPPIVGRTRPGTTVPVEVIRNGDHKTIEVKVGELHDHKQMAGAGNSGGNGPAAAMAADRLGLVVQKLEPDMAQHFKLSAGVVVAQVEQGSPAEMAHVRAGDVITQVGGTSIDSVQTFDKVVGELPAGKPVPVRIVRQGNPGFVAIHVPAKKK